MSLNNEVLNCIHERRSTRRFTDQQISSEQLDALLDARVLIGVGPRQQVIIPMKDTKNKELKRS